MISIRPAPDCVQVICPIGYGQAPTVFEEKSFPQVENALGSQFNEWLMIMLLVTQLPITRQSKPCSGQPSIVAARLSHAPNFDSDVLHP